MNQGLVELMCECVGWTPITQVVTVLKLIEKRRLGYIVDVSVFGGRSFLPLAFAARRVRGVAVAIDPFYPIDPNEKFYRDYAHFDFNKLKNRLKDRVKEYQLQQSVKFIFKDPEFVSMKLPKGIDLLHITGHTGRFAGFTALRRYNKKVKVGGFLWIEDFSETDFEAIFKETKSKYRIYHKFDAKNFILERL